MVKKEKTITNWEKTRKKGKWRFIWLTGFAFMIIMLIVSNLIDYTSNKLPSPFFTTKNIAMQLTSKAIGGFLFGLCMWYFQEKNYKKLLRKKQNESKRK